MAEARELRNELREAGAHFEVTKNTLMMRAVDEAGAAEIKEYLSRSDRHRLLRRGCGQPREGPGQVSPRSSNRWRSRAACSRASSIDVDKIKFLASLPPREVLLAQLLGAMQGPIRGLATVCAGPIRGLVTVLQRIQEQKEAA